MIKIKAKTTAELIENFQLSDEAETIVMPEVPPHESIMSLLEGEHYLDAIKLISHGLPKREAVWWACIATRQSQTKETPPLHIKALLSAERWVQKPTEENRKLASKLAAESKYQSAASWAATAAYWSAGSIAPVGEPDVPPPEHLYAHAVAGSVALAAAEGDEEGLKSRYVTLITQGIDLANGGQGRLSS
ncbi:hypothetical protein EDC56_2683 [Sinobacterium caligoides]|uniref:Uncharacterized protein n=1 Tax=Sinobacterium caligoides TaxID=933926 RepID=A0A3N2DK41_9GAMM|nr:hypothetical protein [Sinobacterium caligoides]ROS00049.1 hypothetical protein EDC56_2683 [Sinobacterium caligoides]